MTKWEDMGAQAVLGLNNANGALGDVEGTMGKMQKTQQEAFGVRWQKLMRTTMASLEPLGQAILDIAEVALPPIIKAVEVVAKAFSSMPKPIQIGIVAILGMVAVLGPLVAMMGFMTSGVGAFVGSLRFLVPILTKVPLLFTGILKVGPKLIGMFGGIGKALALLGRSMMTLLMNPWTIAILAIVGLVYLIYKNWDDIVKYTKKAVKWIGDVCSKAWDATVKGAKKAWNGLGKFFSGFWNGTKKLFKSASSFLGKVLEEAWKYIKQRIEYNIKIWKNIFEFGWNAIKFVFNLALSGLKKIVDGTWKFIKNSVQKAVDTWKKIFTTGWNAIKRIFSMALAIIKQYVKTELRKNEKYNIWCF